MDDRYRQIIFIDGPEAIGDSIKNNARVFFAEIDGKSSHKVQPWFEFLIKLKLRNGDNWVEFLENSKDGFVFPDSKNFKYDFIYMYINDIPELLSEYEYHYYHCKIEFFGILNDITNERVFFLIDRSQKIYVMEHIDKYLVYIKRIKNKKMLKENTTADIDGQMLFVESLENIQLEKDDFFSTIDGEHCDSKMHFYSEVMLQLGFPYWFGRNMAAFNDLLDSPESTWSWALKRPRYLGPFFLRIENTKKILPRDDVERIVFFKTLEEAYYRVFVIFDKSDKEFVMNEIENYKKL
ncbi:MAG: barstar family protein [Rickettsiales bacterium]|jgi:hypothetical protein|nr:barstar family protein [Rickettsiales bacterium]